MTKCCMFLSVSCWPDCPRVQAVPHQKAVFSSVHRCWSWYASTQKGCPRSCLQVLVLVRIEVDVASHAQFQVTVASPDVQLTAAVKNVLLLQLAGMPSA